MTDKLTFKDNSKKVMREINIKTIQALEAASIIVEEKAISRVPVDTGRLRSSISHVVDGDSSYIGSNVEYAPYIEYGTIKQKAQPFLRSAIIKSKNQIKNIMKNMLKTDVDLR